MDGEVSWLKHDDSKRRKISQHLTVLIVVISQGFLKVPSER